MNFEFNDEQRMLADGARTFLRKKYGMAERRRQLHAEPHGFNRKLWKEFAELGWLGIAIREDHGGFGPDLVAGMALVEAFGEHLVTTPFVECTLESVSLLTALGSLEHRGEWLPRIASGEALVVLAHTERAMDHAWTAIEMTARTGPSGVTLCGYKSAMPFAASADRWIVTAHSADGGLTAWLVDPATPGITMDSYRAFDETPVTDIRFDNIVVPPSAQLGHADETAAALEITMAIALAATCVEAIGAMSTLLALTLDYAKIRKQFGMAIGNFQVIQHRLVDMFAKLELSRSLAWLAVSVAERPQGQQLLLSGAKAQISDACRLIREEAVQIHGGIGMTDEADCSHYFKRLLTLEKKLGDRHYHLGLLADALMAANTGIYT